MRGQVEGDLPHQEGHVMIYRVRATDEPLVYYAGRSFKVASWRFSQELGNRLMERYLGDGWQTVMLYYDPMDARLRQLAASWMTTQLRRHHADPVE